MVINGEIQWVQRNFKAFKVGLMNLYGRYDISRHLKFLTDVGDFNGFEGKLRDLKEFYVVLRDWDLIEFKQILLGFEGLGRIVRNVKGS